MINKIDMDNGSFPLAKDSLKVLAKTNLSGAHRAIIDVVWLQTYGWYDDSNEHEQKIKKRRIVAQINYDVFINETYMDKTNISKRLNQLIDWNIIIRDKNTSPYTYSFNVNINEWDVKIFRKTKNVVKTINSCENDQQLLGLPISSCEDDQQLLGLPTSSCEDDQLEVVRMTNSCEAETQEGQDMPTSLNNIKESIKEINTTISTSEPENQYLQIIKNIKGWPYDFEIDLEHYRQLVNDFPSVSIIDEIKKLRDWFKDNPIKKKSNPRLRLRNWCDRSKKYKESRGGSSGGNNRDSPNRKIEVDTSKFLAKGSDQNIDDSDLI